MSDAPRRAPAFTLLELVVVLAVVALAAAVVVPRVGAVRGVVVDVEARKLADAIAFGRERAILSGAPMRLVVDADGAGWRLGKPGREPGTLVADTDASPVERPTRLPGDVRVRAVTVGGVPAALLELRPDGDALPARIDLGDRQGRGATVVVPPARARPLVMKAQS